MIFRGVTTLIFHSLKPVFRTDQLDDVSLKQYFENINIYSKIMLCSVSVLLWKSLEAMELVPVMLKDVLRFGWVYL